MNEGSLPAVLLTDPYHPPLQTGADPFEAAPGDGLDSAGAVGVSWQPDWRGEVFQPSQYQGFGGPEATFLNLSQPTSWSPYTGLVESQPYVHGYVGTELQETTFAELRAGSTIFWPTSGQEEPGSDPILLEIPFDSGTDVGWQQSWEIGRRMLFSEPLDYSSQTDAIPAAGWP